MAPDRRADQVRQALANGDAFTRIEACERFGISGSTFRWLIRSLLDSGAALEFEEVPGRRGSVQRRWKLAAAGTGSVRRGR